MEAVEGVQSQTVIQEELYNSVEPLCLLFEHLLFLSAPLLCIGLTLIHGGCQRGTEPSSTSVRTLFFGRAPLPPL